MFLHDIDICTTETTGPLLLFAVTFALGVLGGSLAIVLIQLGKNMAFDIVRESLFWIGIEVALIVGVALLAYIARKHNLLPVTIIRKFFHGLSLRVDTSPDIA